MILSREAKKRQRINATAKINSQRYMKPLHGVRHGRVQPPNRKLGPKVRQLLTFGPFQLAQLALSHQLGNPGTQLLYPRLFTPQHEGEYRFVDGEAGRSQITNGVENLHLAGSNCRTHGILRGAVIAANERSPRPVVGAGRPPFDN